jgi:hypothetical protein
MTEQHITGVLALGPGRAALATLEQVLAQSDLRDDMIAIVGDADGRREKRDTYRALFSTLGRARRPVLWVPGPVDGRLEPELRRAYDAAGPRPAAQTPRNVLFARQAPPTDIGPAAGAIVAELMRTFEPRLAPRLERPAVYLVRERGHPEWLEL